MKWHTLKYYVCGMCGVIWAHCSTEVNATCPDCGNEATQIYRENFDEKSSDRV